MTDEPRTGRPRVAIAHDYLTQRGGAERVVLAMHRAFPEATIHTTLYDPDGTFPEFRDAEVRTSPLDRVATLRRDHRAALPLLPWAVRRLPVDADVVIVSSSGWAHGVPTRGRKLVYCHAPARWLYQTEAYLGGPVNASLKGRVVGALRPWLTRWDRRAAATADRYVVNSTVVQARVHEAYGIDADVLPPPYGIDPAGVQRAVPQLEDWSAGGYHLVVSRLLPYKNVDRAVEAFRLLGSDGGERGEGGGRRGGRGGRELRLVVVGHGPLEATLSESLPPNVRLVSGLDDDQLRWVYAHATALVAPSLEDFGLTPVEAAAFGRPTIALHAGGYLDTVDESVNGVFFDEPTAEHIARGVTVAAGRTWDSAAIRRHAEQFSEQTFHARLRAEVERLLDR